MEKNYHITPALSGTEAAHGQVKLREKSTNYAKTPQRGLIQTSRPFSCDVEHLSKLNGLSYSYSRIADSTKGVATLNGSYQVLNNSPADWRPFSTSESPSEAAEFNEQVSDKGPTRLYERRLCARSNQGAILRKMNNYANLPASSSSSNSTVYRSASQIDLLQTPTEGGRFHSSGANYYPNACSPRTVADVESANNSHTNSGGKANSASSICAAAPLPQTSIAASTSIDFAFSKQDQPLVRDPKHAQRLQQQRCSLDQSRYTKPFASPLPKQISKGSEQHTTAARASLRREEAVDLPTYSSSEPSICPTTSPATPLRESKFGKKDSKTKTSRTKSSSESILKKLINATYKTHSADIPDHNMSTPVGSKEFAKMEANCESTDLKYEEKLRRKIFAHYDCSSICADVVPLLNGTSRLKETNLTFNSTTGASQASRTSKGSDSIVGDDTGSSDNGDGKSNDLLLNCPFFRNELGGEPTKMVALKRDVSSNTSCTNQPKSELLETWLQAPTAAEASVLENLSNVYLGGRLCAKRQDPLVIEHIDQGAFFYRHCFAGKVHHNYFGIDDNLGPVAISVIRDKIELVDHKKHGLIYPYLYRVIVRLSDLNTYRGTILEDSLPSHQQNSKEAALTAASTQSPGSSSGGTGLGKLPVKDLLELIIPDLQLANLRLALPVPRTEDMLLKLDEQGVYTRFKVGILYCGSNQCTEEQMYNNEKSGPAFDEFLDMLGQRVRLKGFDKYKGGLDIKGDTTGQFSVYTTHQQYEIMFHVSTMLPFTPSNKQQLSRKRHIGNDIVTVVFQEPDSKPFSPQTVRSHFQHVFIVVRALDSGTENVRYSVAVSRSKNVPAFGPAIPAEYMFPKSNDFRDFLLTKIINAENAVHKSDKFATMAARTRREFMRDLAENHVTSQYLDIGTSGKIGKILGGGTSKTKVRAKPKLFLDHFVRGAIVWDVQVLAMVEDFALCKSIECYLGVSADYVVLIDKGENRDTLFCAPTHSIIGWTSHANSLKLYYDHAEVIILRTIDDDDGADLHEIVRRLHHVTKGCETVEMILRRNTAGQLGFNIQQEGIVTDVEMYNSAWIAGLRQGSRLVEICKVNVVTLTYERMLELLRTSVNIRVLVIMPLEDGSPRRGCEDPYCPAVLANDPTFPIFLIDKPLVPQQPPDRQPPSYETAMLRKQLAVNPVYHQYRQDSELMSPEARTDNGYESGSNVISKSLEDIQKRRHSDELRSTSADHGFYRDSGFENNYQSNTISSLSSEEHWQWNTNDTNYPHQRLNLRTDTLSSSGSTASSEMSSDSVTMQSARKRSNRPSSLKRKVDKCNSDTVQRLQDSKLLNTVVPPLPPKTYKESSPTIQPRYSSGQLTVPLNMTKQHQKISQSCSSVQENLIRLISDIDVKSNFPPTSSVRPTNLRISMKYAQGRSWNNLLDVDKCEPDIVDAQRGFDMLRSPEASSYQAKYQTAMEKIKDLEDNVNRIQVDLLREKESTQKLNFEVISLKEANQRLLEEKRQADAELKKLTDFIFKAVDNKDGASNGVTTASLMDPSKSFKK